jgi:multiple sugar transport system permease protein
VRRRPGPLYYVGLAGILAFFLLPFVVMTTNALKTEAQITAYPPVWIFAPTGKNFAAVLGTHAFARYIMNSTIIGLGATLLGFALGLPAAYSIARHRQGRLAFLILCARMVPYVSCILPWYVITRKLGLIDTYPPLILTHLVFTLPLCVGVMIGYFEDVPRELEEAAWLDGCSRLGTFVRIALPLVRPGIVATAILAFTTSWNNFLFALVLTGTSLKTAPVAVFNFISFEEYNWGAVSAAAILITLPVLAFVFLVQRQLIHGLTAGGLR